MMAQLKRGHCTVRCFIIPDDWRKSIPVPVYKGKCNPLVCGPYRAIKLLEKPMKVIESVGKEDQMSGAN